MSNVEITLDIKLTGLERAKIQSILDELDQNTETYKGQNFSDALDDPEIRKATEDLLKDVEKPKLTAYDDSFGKGTVGVGCNMDQYRDVDTPFTQYIYTHIIQNIL